MALYLLLLLAAVSFSGCGSTDTDVAAPTDRTGASVAAGASPSVGTTDATGSTSADADKTAEASTFPVNIGLRDGKFTPGTEREISVIDGVSLQFEFDVRDNRSYEIQVADNLGGNFESFRFDTRGNFESVLGPLKPDQSLTLTLGEERVVITTGFEPGP